MIFRNTAGYFAARALPAVLTVVAIAVYTRLLEPREYGRYALVFSAVVLFNIAFFYWIKVALVRFHAAHAAAPGALYRSVLACYGMTCAGVAAIGALALAVAWDDPAWRALVALAVPLVCVQGWFELNLSLATAQARPARFGLLSGTKALVALGAGTLLALYGAGAFGPLAGLLLGMLAACALRNEDRPRFSHLGKPGKEGAFPDAAGSISAELLRYGLPLAAGFMLACVVVMADRFLVAAILGEAAAGRYAANADLAQQALLFLMMTVSFASWPLVVRALEREGAGAARELALRGTALLLAIAVPSAAGLALLSREIGGLLLGEGFRHAALLPVLAAATLLAGVKTYHFDLAFQLGLRTALNVSVWLLVAAANVGFNLWWIPAWGLPGAAASSLAAYALGLAASAWLGRRVFALPFPWRDLARVLAATAAMAAVLIAWPFAPSIEEARSGAAATQLALQIVSGAAAYAVAALVFDVCGMRERLFTALGLHRRGPLREEKPVQAPKGIAT